MNRVKNKGFSLIEVTIALAIFALASVVFTQSFLGGMFSLESIKFNDAQSENVNMAYRHILAIESRDDLLKGGSMQSLNRGLLVWGASVKATDVTDLFKATIQVKFPEEKLAKKSESLIEEDFYLFRPGWSNVDEKPSSIDLKRNLIHDESKK